jgi:hypothetical protein
VPIGMFIDGSFIYKSYPDQIDYLKLRTNLETHLADAIDEAYYLIPMMIRQRRRSSTTT